MFVQCFTIKSHCIFVSLKTSCTIKTRCIDDDIHYVGVVKPHHRLMHGARRKKVECNRYHIAKCAAVLLCGDMDRYNNDILSLLWFRPLLLARLGCCSVELHRGESLISPVSVTSCCSSRSVMFFSLFDVCSCIRCSTVPAQCTLHLGCLAFRLFDDQESSSFPLRSHAPALRAPIRPWERKRAPGTGFVIIFKSSQVILAKLMYFFGWICLTSL